MLEVLTPLNKVERVSRVIDPSNFVAVPGIWAELSGAGALSNIATSDETGIRKMVMGSASSNVYESHDVEVGRIATMESFGIRVKVDTEGYTGAIVAGNFLVVSAADGTEGKLIAEGVAPSGNYTRVAQVEEYSVSASTIVFRTISPVDVAL